MVGAPLTKPIRVTAIGASGQLGGTERVLLDLASHATDVDLQLRVVVPKHGPLIAALRECGVPAEVVDAPASLLRSSQQPGHLWTAAPASLGLLKWAKRLKHHNLVHTADVLYTISFKPHLAAALGRMHPSVWHLHEYPPRATGRLWRFFASHIPDALVANSSAVADTWGSSALANSRRITTVHNGVDLRRFAPRAPTKWIHDRLGISHTRRLIGMPAVLARWKGQLAVVAAFRQIQNEFPNMDLVLVGGSIYDTVAERKYGRELERVVRRGEEGHPAPPRVYLLPFQKDIERVYPEFDITVHYSLRPEPFGRVIVESMACGVPVIAADEGGPREILGAEPAGGWLEAPRDPDSLAATLRNVLQQPEDTLRIEGATGRRRVEARFSARRFAEEMSAVFRRVASAQAARARAQ